jgi:hypothetical protein
MWDARDLLGVAQGVLEFLGFLKMTASVIHAGSSLVELYAASPM